MRMAGGLPLIGSIVVAGCMETAPLDLDATPDVTADASSADALVEEALPLAPIEAGRWNDVTVLMPSAFAEVDPHPEGFRNKTVHMFVATFTTAEGAERVYGGVGGPFHNNGSYLLVKDTIFHVSAARDGAGRLSTSPFDVHFVLGLGLDLALVDAELTTMVTTPGAHGSNVIASGDFSAVLTPENADQVYLSPTLTLREFLLLFPGLLPDVDHNQDGTLESWRFKYHFETEVVLLY